MTFIESLPAGRNVLAAVAAGLLLASGGTAGAQAEAATTLGEAVTDGDVGIDLRYRYEFVDQDGFADNAHASTARLRLNYQTGTFQKFSAFGEFDYVAEVFLNDFNSLSGSSPSRNRYPAVADAKGADLNQLYLQFDSGAEDVVRIGRQKILYDNQRFVGAVGWRQNEQTYDGLSLDLRAAGETRFRYAYLTAVRRIFGSDVPAGRNDVDAHLLNANVMVASGWDVTPYYYRIDNKDVASFSTGTFGVRLSGKLPLREHSLQLAAEFANQTGISNNPVNYDARYFHVAATLLTAKDISAGIAFESLGGEQNDPTGSMSFKTPLATLHGFQGWADQFLTTPGGGVDDLYLSVSGKAGKWTLTGVYHDFSAASGSADWGSELDLSAGAAISERYSVLFKAALYDADAFSRNIRKFWIMFSGSY